MQRTKAKISESGEKLQGVIQDKCIRLSVLTVILDAILDFKILSDLKMHMCLRQSYTCFEKKNQIAHSFYLVEIINDKHLRISVLTAILDVMLFI